MDRITSLHNPNVKQLVRLRERQRERRKTGKFLVEGFREIFWAVRMGHPIDSLYICPEYFLGENESTLIEQIQKNCCHLTLCTKEVFQKISYRDRPDGLLAVAPHLPCTFAQLQHKGDTPLLVVAESVEKPGNLGTILRSSDAAGATGVIVCDPCTDIHNPNVVRASVGTLFTVPIVLVQGEEALSWLKKQRIQVVSATPHAETSFTEVNLQGPIALAVGTEQLGLSKLWIEQADIRVRIPMKGAIDSLNVAAATTLLLYEAQRQRSARSV